VHRYHPAHVPVTRHSPAVLILLAAVAAAAPARGADCSADRFDGQARIRHVIDGDTVILSDESRLRLVGLDAPELGREGRPAEAGAETARQFLSGLLPRNTSVRLVGDAERLDRHGRRLAHLFLADGSNVQQQVLAAGLAVPLTIPPNLRFADCYAQSAAAARNAGRGLWSLPQYRPIEAALLPEGARGYHVVAGRIDRRGESRDSIWLNFGPRFAVRILRSDLARFSGLAADEVIGRAAEARGMVYRRGGQLRMRIRHPLDLTLSDAVD
jgi:micrococcal nuclease